jgi:hypothetical protein
MLDARIHGSEVGAEIHGSKLGDKICGSEVPATSDAMLWVARHLEAKICGAETCYIGATSSGADPLGPKMTLRLLGGQT